MERRAASDGCAAWPLAPTKLLRGREAAVAAAAAAAEEAEAGGATAEALAGREGVARPGMAAAALIDGVYSGGRVAVRPAVATRSGTARPGVAAEASARTTG